MKRKDGIKVIRKNKTVTVHIISTFSSIKEAKTYQQGFSSKKI